MKQAPTRWAIWATCTYFILSFYIYGGTVVEVFVYYPSWEHVHHDWTAFKQGVDHRLILLYVVPCFLLFLPLTLLFWHRHKAIPRWTLWMSLLLYALPTVSTMLLQLPIQLRLARGWDATLYRRLIAAEWPARQVWTLLGFVLNCFMLYRITAAGSERQPSGTREASH